VEEVIKRSIKNNMESILCVCPTFHELDIFLQLRKKHPFIYGAIGIHPHDASGYRDGEQNLGIAIKEEEIVALGEIGLDYHYENSCREIQAEVFRKQLRLAKENGLPVIIHSRDAMHDTLRILGEEKIKKGVMHCFSGTVADMGTCVDMGFYISVAGPVTFPNAKLCRAIAGSVPAERLLIETDCPYLSPQPVRGKRNEPSFLKYIVERIAEIRNVTISEIDETTSRNARILFKI